MRAPAHLRAAVRLLERCGIDEAVVGDLLEMHEARPSVLRIWREVAGAFLATGIGHLGENKPQAVRRAATAAAAIWLLGYSVTGYSRVDMARSLRVEELSGGWFETDAANGRTRLLPTATFQLRNISTEPLTSVQVNVLFRRGRDREAWSDVFRKAVSRQPLASGMTTGQIVAQSPVGYTGDEATNHLLTNSHFVDTGVAIYARHGSDEWTLLDEFPLPRRIVGQQFGYRAERTAFGSRLR